MNPPLHIFNHLMNKYLSKKITSRQYQSEADLVAMQSLLKESRFLTDDWCYAHVGDLLFWFFQIAIHLNPHEHIRLWYADEKLVGYSILGEDPSFDVQVHPEFIWQGIEEQALEWAEKRLIELRCTEATLWGGNLVSGSRQDDPARITFLEQHGFHAGGEFSEVNMLCSLNHEIPEGTIPDGYVVRSVSEQGELSNRAEAQRDVWHPWTVGNLKDEDYTMMMRLSGYDRELDVVAITRDGVIAAYVNGWNDDLNKIGDFGPLGTRPAYRRQGLMRVVLLECLRRMQARRMNRVCVSTGVTNFPAQKLYEGVGFKIANQYLEFVKPG
ncbi:MAG: GNAT family N-acetyltransferase [Anaerolineaceae bacterium]|nr:GNAT family N-acetyltransferase [Anaerolineaceae bacterium]